MTYDEFAVQYTAWIATNKMQHQFF